MRRWRMHEARARLTDLVAAARTAPQEITVRGEPAVVVLSREAYARLSGRRLPLHEFLRRSPLAGVTLDLRRDKSPARRA